MIATTKLVCTIFCTIIIVRLTSQSLLTGNGNGLPDFRSYSTNFDKIGRHHLAIIYTYRFNCCGNITEWGVDVHPGSGREDGGQYSLDFQVWRPSPTVNDFTGAGCYSLVGNNSFTSISLSNGLARITPSPQHHITYRPGDVIGFYVKEAREENHGIVVLSDAHELVWHASIEPNEATRLRNGCPYPWPPGSDLSINLTRAAPVISIGTSTYPCPTTPPSAILSSTAAIGTFPSPTTQSSAILLSTAAIGCPLKSSDTNMSGGSLTPPVYFLFGFIVGIVILILIVVPANVIIFLKKSRAIQDRLSNQVHESIVRDQSNSSTFNVMLPLKEPPAEDTSVYYEPIGQGEDQNLERAVNISHETPNVQTFQMSMNGNTFYKEFEDGVLDSVGTHIPTIEERERGNYERDDQQETEAYSQLNFFKEEQVFWAPASTTSDLYSQLAAKKFREISREQIQILEPISAGQFGEVCRAQWTVCGATKDIAVKTLRTELPEKEKVRFLQEAAIMGQFSHPNVIKLHGVVTAGDPAMICTELMVNSDLRNYLCSIDPVQQSYEELGKKFVQFSQQIASGMDYLSKKSFVHRDLAARNILLDEALHCKIGDFGMARDLMDDSYYTSATKGGKIPIKWTAPEALFYKKYSTDSDVWSYGMVLFEIWSVGKKPFSKLSNNQTMKLLQTGYCQPPPPGCPRAIYKLMVDCWNPEHHQRPSFEEICAYLQQPINKLVHWSRDDDGISATEDGNVLLGAELQAATHLYLDLQKTYTSISSELKNGNEFNDRS